MILAFGALISAAIIQQTGTPPSAPSATDTSASTSSVEQQIAQAASLGQMIYAFDRAAWVSSDALMAVVPKNQLVGAGGYVVELADPQTLHVTYYRGSATAAQAFFVADVRGGKVVRKELLATPIPLSSEQAALARARELATDSARERSYAPCTPAPFNTVVLPTGKGGPAAVYLLSAQVDAATYPIGGSYRVIVAPDGQVLASRPYSAGCLNMRSPKPPKGASPAGLVVTHVLDPVPTEIHVFASYNLRMPVFVLTSDKRVWQVQGSRITVSPLK